MSTPESYAEEFRAAAEGELRASLDDAFGSHIVTNSDGEEVDFSWRNGQVTHVKEEADGTLVIIKLGVHVFVESVQTLS